MRTIMDRSPHESSFSLSKRHLHWIVAKVSGDGGGGGRAAAEDDEEAALAFSVSSDDVDPALENNHKKKKKKMTSAVAAVTRWVSGKHKVSRVSGTMFGHRRGRIHLAFQLEKASSSPPLLFELAMHTSALLKEMASGLVRIALECERRGGGGKLKEEALWRAYCNGRKCGYAVRRECGEGEWRVLKAVEPVSMGAGVLPGVVGGDEGEMMYMRARFERVVGSRDSEAFYMMNPDGKSGPELSIYLIRV